MKNRKVIVFMILLFILNSFLLTGCWDSIELDQLYIVTGIGMDKVEEEDFFDLSVQIGLTTKGGGASDSSGTSQESPNVLVLNQKGENVFGTLKNIGLRTSRELMIDHNQVLLIGRELAEQGILKNLDFYVRSQESRIEAPIIICEGKAIDIFKANIKQENNTALFLNRLIEGTASTTSNAKIRLIDLMQRLLFEKGGAVVPFVELSAKEENQQEISLTGMAVLNDGKMVGKLSLDETKGYLMSMGSFRNYEISAISENQKVDFSASCTKSKMSVKVNPDNTVETTISITGQYFLGEIKGFENIKIEDLIENLNQLANQVTVQTMTKAIEKSKELNSDIFKIGEKIWKKQPKLWQENLYSKWQEIYPNINFKIESNIKVEGTGDTVQSLEMEKARKSMEMENANW